MINSQWGFNPIIIRMLFAVTLFQQDSHSLGQTYLMVALDHKGFTTKIVEYLRKAYHDQYQESSDIRDKVYEDHYQPLEEEQDLSRNPIECNKDITRDVNYEDEAPVTPPQSDEALQDPIPPAQDEENEVSHFPFQFFDDTLFYDSESEEEMEP
jgi:hypothetical protein